MVAQLEGLEREAAFWDKIAQRYARQPVKDEEAYQHKLELTRKYLTPGMDVLEFGCGTGSTALLHAPFVRHLDAIDFSSEMISIARSKAVAARVKNVNFEVSSMEEWTVRHGTYAAVLGLSVLHLVDDVAATICKVYDLLQPGGYFFSSTVCAKDMGYFPRLLVPLVAATGIGPRITVLNRDELVALLKEAGFAITQNWRPGPKKAVFLVARKPVKH